jgi:Na+-driven multidrug efflux pump
MMVIRGGKYILVLSIGGTLFIFLPFLTDALCQAQATVISQLIGAERIHKLKKALRSGYLLVLILSACVAVPLLFFPLKTFHFLFPDQILDQTSIYWLLLGVFASFCWLMVSYIPISTILAFRDMRFSFVMGLINWVNGFLLMYLFIEKVEISANHFWLALSLMHASNALLYHLRSRYLFHRLFVAVKIPESTS